MALFELIEEALAEKGLHCLVIGAKAMSFYRVTREAADLDLLVKRDLLAQWKEFLSERGYRVFHENEIDLSSDGVKQWFLRYGPEESYEKIRLACQG